METKSRYQVIAELEQQKHQLIIEKEGFGDRLKGKKRQLRDMKREYEDSKEELKEYEDSLTGRKETIKELIKSVDESLARFAELSKATK